MFFAFGDLLLQEEFGPGAVEHRLISVFEEALMNEMGSTPAPMDPVLIFAATLGEWSNAAILLDGQGALVTRAITAKGTTEPWRQGGSGAGEALPDKSIGVASEEFFDGGVVCFERER